MGQHIRLRKEPNLAAKHTAFAYQLEAATAVRDLEYAAIFHEQGLGKTKIAVDVLLYWLEKKIVDTVLIVVKKGLVRNWQKELASHTFIVPKLLTQSHKANFFVFNAPARVVLTHYEVLKGEKERMKLFLKTRDVGVILDESAKIKNPDSELTSAFLDLSPLFKRRIIMTGTPVANRPYDVWAQVHFLDGGTSLGQDFPEFRRKADLSNTLAHDPDAQERFEDCIEGIFDRISPFSVRETKNSGIISLPEKVIETVSTAWETHQHELYRQIRSELRAVVVRDGLPTEDRAEDVLKRLLRLVQIASNPHLVDASYSAEPGKLLPLTDLVERISRSGEKAIVWTSFTDNVDWLAKTLRGYGTVKVHGKLTIEERNRAIDKFQAAPDVRLLMATPGAAKEGLTLTVANHVIFYDRGFSLDDYLQAQDRIHRISQKRTCHVHNLVMEDSVDEWVDVLLHSKQMAAQLAQGDVSLEYYKSQMSYAFGDVLKSILDM
ncbi:MAG: DEAD/DEAH box helicase [Phycisphaerae bacterium]|jgi:SNF2 family DNA or RNA helicase